ncbi:MAG: phosphatase PAP2 family protein [Patescibacteria group bacterium]
MNFNVSLFFTVNKLVGRNRWLDLFGRAGAEFVVIAMFGWYIGSVFLSGNISRPAVLVRTMTLAVAWLLGWLIDLAIGAIVKEPRPQVKYPETKVLFQPMMIWKSFPSDHAMSAFLMVFLSLLFGLPGVEGLFIMALWVCWGRVYCGLHYPFDLVGGMTVAALVTVISYNVLLILF